MQQELNQGIKVDLAKAPWNECECGGKIFEPRLMFKRISPIVSPSGQEEMVPIETFICATCSKIPGFVSKKIPGIPKELQAIAPIIGNDTLSGTILKS